VDRTLKLIIRETGCGDVIWTFVTQEPLAGLCKHGSEPWDTGEPTGSLV
jgi:hypothetical protein